MIIAIIIEMIWCNDNNLYNNANDKNNLTCRERCSQKTCCGVITAVTTPTTAVTAREPPHPHKPTSPTM